VPNDGEDKETKIVTDMLSEALNFYILNHVHTPPNATYVGVNCVQSEAGIQTPNSGGSPASTDDSSSVPRIVGITAGFSVLFMSVAFFMLRTRRQRNSAKLSLPPSEGLFTSMSPGNLKMVALSFNSKRSRAGPVDNDNVDIRHAKLPSKSYFDAYADRMAARSSSRTKRGFTTPSVSLTTPYADNPMPANTSVRTAREAEIQDIRQTLQQLRGSSYMKSSPRQGSGGFLEDDEDDGDELLTGSDSLASNADEYQDSDEEGSPKTPTAAIEAAGRKHSRRCLV
jgi:hypothetical protein